MKKLLKEVIFILIISGFGLTVNAREPGEQTANDPGAQRFSGDRPGMMGDPAQMQKIVSERLKEILELNDEEWKILSPKVMNVLSLSFEQRGNPVRMLDNRPGTQGQAPPRRPNSDMQKNSLDESMQQLQKLLEDKDMSIAEIKDQVIKVRRDREKLERKKMAAQNELRELLSVRQEAILISMGLLD